MKIVLTLTLLFICVFVGLAQEKYFSRDAHINFFSSTPFEDINAENQKVTTVMDEASGNLEFSALMKSFEFEKALMEEHFNENYVESNTYPKATFKGMIEKFRMGTYSDPTDVVAVGKLTIHGTEREVKIRGTLQKLADGYIITSTFQVKPEDYKIEIPKVVRDKIANEIRITVNANLLLLKN